VSTLIEWTDITWNAITGCEPISEGCKHCYAAKMANRLRGRYGYPETNPFTPGVVHADKWDLPLRKRKPLKIFVNSMGDVFHDAVPTEAINNLFLTMAISGALAQGHAFQLLTKRPDRMAQEIERIGTDPVKILTDKAGWETPYSDELLCHAANSINGELGEGHNVGWPLRNLWLGVTAENQARADGRIPVLLEIPAAVRFVSIEPMLEPIDIARWLKGTTTHHMRASVEGMIRNRAFDCFNDDDGQPMSPTDAENELYRLHGSGVKYIPVGPKCEGFTSEDGCPGHRNPALDWVIVGSETGPGKRIMDNAWARKLQHQCTVAEIPFFFKKDSRGKTKINGREWLQFPEVA